MELSARLDSIARALKDNGDGTVVTTEAIVLWSGKDLGESKTSRAIHTGHGSFSNALAAAQKAQVEAGLVLVPAKSVLELRDAVTYGGREYTSFHGGRVYFKAQDFAPVANDVAKDLPGFQAPRLPRNAAASAPVAREVAPF